MTSTAPDQEVPAPVPQKFVRNSSFYFDDDPMVIFLVDGELFKVHRHFFIQGSQLFRDMFSSANTNQEGESDEAPIVLPNVTRAEFQALLRFFYSLPSRVTATGAVVLPGVTEISLEDKLSLLSISHRFLFDDIFQFILQQVQPSSIPIVDRLRLSDKYNIVRWLPSTYVTLLDRSPGDLSTEEAAALGFERVARLYKAKCFMCQERNKQAGESPSTVGKSVLDDNLHLWGGFNKAFDSGSQSNPTIQVPSSPGQSRRVNPGKSLTPTSDVVKKFFKLG